MNGDLGTCIGLALAATRRASIMSRRDSEAGGEAGLVDVARRALGDAASEYADRRGVQTGWFDHILAIGNAEEVEVIRLLLDAVPAIMALAENRPSTELIHVTATAALQNVIRLGRAWCHSHGLRAYDVDTRLIDVEFYRTGKLKDNPTG